MTTMKQRQRYHDLRCAIWWSRAMIPALVAIWLSQDKAMAAFVYMAAALSALSLLYYIIHWHMAEACCPENDCGDQHRFG